MAGYDLPTSVVVDGIERPIRSDYRAVLDVMQVMADPEIADDERSLVTLSIFYPDIDEISDYEEAIERMFWFVGGGETKRDGGPRRPRLMDWDQDFPLIVSPVNHVLGYEVRAVEYLHWWTFLAAYREIGDCTFAQVVSIRKKKLMGKKLDKSDQEFYSNNRELVDLRITLTEDEEQFFRDWIT